MEVSPDEVSGRGKRPEVVRARKILMTLGVERYGLRVTGMGAALDVRYHSACLWSRRGASRRCDDPGFARTLDAVDRVVASTPPDTVELGTVNV